MYISLTRQDLFVYALVALLVGFTLTQIGMYMGNRYGRKPRPDEKLDAGLKGLPGEFTMYHYTTPASHLLVGPAGVWLLMPYHQRGKVAFKKNRWQMSGGGFLHRECGGRFFEGLPSTCFSDPRGMRTPRRQQNQKRAG